MLVQRASMPMPELEAFEAAIRASGRDPGAFKAQVFEAAANDPAIPLRRVHIVTSRAAAQYDASPGAGWTESFARHLARGFFG
jgi:hypothetical protein